MVVGIELTFPRFRIPGPHKRWGKEVKVPVSRNGVGVIEI